MIEAAHENCDIIIVLSGDGDYEPAINYIVNNLNK